jgi:UDP-N-acetyl-D-mannosaminuronic acid transferase (WecB/TagA/CpsF family)
MLNLPSHNGKANQNYFKILLHSCLNGYHQEQKQQQMLVKMWGKSNPHTLLVGM